MTFYIQFQSIKRSSAGISLKRQREGDSDVQEIYISIKMNLIWNLSETFQYIGKLGTVQCRYSLSVLHLCVYSSTSGLPHHDLEEHLYL